MVSVSILVPTYNSLPTLARALDSVVKQSFTEWELILVDDASQDGTVEFAKSRYGADPRFSFHVKKKNGGPSESRNMGIDVAAGKWIALLDSDDAWAPDRLARLLKLADDFDFVADNVMTYDVAAGEETGPYYLEFEAPVVTLEDYLLGWVGEHPMDGGYLIPLMRTEFLRRKQIRYNTSLRHGEDYLMYCEALCHGARFALVNGCGYIYSTKVGRKSKQLSPHSHTVPDPAAMARALKDLKTRVVHLMTPREEKVFSRTAEKLKTIKHWWDFEDALRTRHYPRCLLLLRHPVVQLKFLGALSRKLRRRELSRPTY